MKEILGFQVDDQVDEVAAALRMSHTLEALIRQRKLKIAVYFACINDNIDGKVMQFHKFDFMSKLLLHNLMDTHW